MKWLKYYNESKWYEYDEGNTPQKMGGNSAAYKALKVFNILFNPLGIQVVLGKINSEDILLTFHIFINFSTDDKSNSIFGPIIEAIFNVKEDFNKIKYTYPMFINGNHVVDVLVSFYKEDARLGKLFDGHDKHVSGNVETRTFKKHLLYSSTEEEALASLIYSINNIFNNMSDVIKWSDSTSIPEVKAIPLFKNVLVRYTNYLHSNSVLTKNQNALDITEPPKILYKIVSEEIASYKDNFSLISKLKDTPLYPKLSLPDNKLETGKELGEIGF